jgi:hypothetical protein
MGLNFPGKTKLQYSFSNPPGYIWQSEIIELSQFKKLQYILVKRFLTLNLGLKFQK